MNFLRILLTCTMVAVTLFAGRQAIAQGQITAEAYSGKPFGLLKITAPNTFGGESFDVFNAEGRILYPAAEAAGQPVRRLVRNLLKIEGPPALTIYCLFKGTDPLIVRLNSPDSQPLKVRVYQDAASHNRLLQAWWKAYRAPTRFWNKTDEYPPQVENYLSAMLSRRLNLPLEAQQYKLFDDNKLDEVLGPLIGTEAARSNLQRDTMLGKFSRVEPATLPIPEIVRPELVLPELSEEVKLETIAGHVPAECYYVRFGSFTNYMWMGVMLEQAGGELRNLVAVRGFHYAMRDRMERQLGLHDTELSKMLGGLVISDVAMIGTDTFFREGAATGIMFEARSADLLANSLKDQRRELLQSTPDAREETVEIAGHDVSFISTPDNTVRSFYAVDGDYHLVTTSRAIAERFFQAGGGDRALRDQPDFVNARSEMPVKRRDTVFIYLSDAFLRNISSPGYRIEMTRRLQAVANLELVKLAQLAAKAEGVKGDTLEGLIAAGLLPQGFGVLADGSRTVLRQGVPVDSLRGPRGAFVPAADIEVKTASRSELDAYQRFASAFQDQWQQFDPIVVGIKRKALEGEHHELLTIDARMTPLGVPQYGWLSSWLGPADNLKMAELPGDVAALDAVLANNRVFGGLRDLAPFSPSNGARPVPQGFMSGPLMGLLTTNPRDYLTGYVGATPQLGPLQFLDDQRFGPPDEAGWSSFQGLLGPSYRRYINGMAVYSYHGDLLAEVTPQLQFVEAERPAQVRLRIEDLREANVGTILNLLAYSRARGTSLGNARFLASLEQQFHVPERDCLATAESILDARPICPLEGEYIVRKERSGQRHWGSTAWNDDGRPLMPSKYRAPTQDWMRSLRADLRFDRNSLVAHAVVDMQFGEESIPKAEEVPAPAPDDANGETESLPAPAADKPKPPKPAPEELEKP